MATKKRLPAFDILKLFAIFMVLYGHCLQYFQTSPFAQDSVYRVIYSFHMPLFMMIGGFFSLHSFQLKFKGLVTKKFWELIYPVIIYGIVFFIISSIITLSQGDQIYPIWDLKAIYTKNLWFLKSEFICYIVAYFCFRKGINIWLLVMSLILSQFVVFHNICTMYPAFILGVFLRKKTKLLDSKILLSISSIMFLLMLFFWDESFWSYEGLWPAPNILKTLTTGNTYYIIIYLQKDLYRVLIGLSGSITFITLFNIFFNKYSNSITKTAAMGGQYTLGVYITQFFVLECFLGSYINFDNADFILFHFVYSPIIAFSLLVIFTTFVKLTYKSKRLSFLMWGKTR